MGYYSSYKIEIKKQPADTKVDLAEFVFFMEDKYEIEDILCKGVGHTYESNDDMKWYEYREHLQAFTNKFPGLVLLCLRKGEEAGDCEKTFFQANGLSNQSSYDETRAGFLSFRAGFEDQSRAIFQRRDGIPWHCL